MSCRYGKQNIKNVGGLKNEPGGIMEDLKGKLRKYYPNVPFSDEFDWETNRFSANDVIEFAESLRQEYNADKFRNVIVELMTIREEKDGKWIFDYDEIYRISSTIAFAIRDHYSFSSEGSRRKQLEEAFNAGKAVTEHEWHMLEFHGTTCQCVPPPFTDFESWMLSLKEKK